MHSSAPKPEGRPAADAACAVTTGRLFLTAPDGRRAQYRRLTVAAQRHPPLYAALVAEWQADGRMVPGAHDAQWAALSVPHGNGHRPSEVPAAPPGLWERVVDLPTVRQARRATAPAERRYAARSPHTYFAVGPPTSAASLLPVPRPLR
ncbi:hypothetical protein [Streptomyces griseosporeus]|uniref:hypothetical protein n=1 Tax=Streptomyces griseosporeus TaxID=1910 RepID=UPI0036F73C7A